LWRAQSYCVRLLCIIFYARRRHWPLVVQYRFVLGELRVAHGLGVFVLAVVVALDSRFARHGGPRMVRTPLEPDGDAQQQQQFGQHFGCSRVITHIIIYVCIYSASFYPFGPPSRPTRGPRPSSIPACIYTTGNFFFFFLYYFHFISFHYPLNGIMFSRSRQMRSPRRTYTRASDLQIRFARARAPRLFHGRREPSVVHSSPVAAMTTTLNPIIGGGSRVLPALWGKKNPFTFPLYRSIPTRIIYILFWT